MKDGEEIEIKSLRDLCIEMKGEESTNSRAVKEVKGRDVERDPKKK